MKKLIVLLLSLGIAILVCLILYFVFLWTQVSNITHAKKDLKTLQTNNPSVETSKATKVTPTHSTHENTISSLKESPSIISSNQLSTVESNINPPTKQTQPNSASTQQQVQKRDQTMKQLFELTEKTSKGESVNKVVLLQHASQFINFVKQGTVTPAEAKSTIEFLITVYPSHQKELTDILKQITNE